MSKMPKSVSIREVGPREGLQFEKGPVTTEAKIRLVDALSETGVKEIEFVSFVSPKWVPQMADAEQVVAGIKKVPGVKYEGITEKGLEIIEGLRGHTTGYAVPTFVIDSPGGGGKIPLQPEYVAGREGDFLLLRNYEGQVFRYPDPVEPA